MSPRRLLDSEMPLVNDVKLLLHDQRTWHLEKNTSCHNVCFKRYFLGTQARASLGFIATSAHCAQIVSNMMIQKPLKIWLWIMQGPCSVQFLIIKIKTTFSVSNHILPYFLMINASISLSNNIANIHISCTTLHRKDNFYDTIFKVLNIVKIHIGHEICPQ